MEVDLGSLCLRSVTAESLVTATGLVNPTLHPVPEKPDVLPPLLWFETRMWTLNSLTGSGFEPRSHSTGQLASLGPRDTGTRVPDQRLPVAPAASEETMSQHRDAGSPGCGDA